MLLNIIMSTVLFFAFLVFGNLMMFLEVQTYWLIVPYVIAIILLNRVYHETCKTMEKKDFVFSLLIVLFDMFLLNLCNYSISFDIFSYLYLSTIVPFLSFATTIRFKSLM